MRQQGWTDGPRRQSGACAQVAPGLSKAGHEGWGTGVNKTILVVDDDVSIADLLTQALSEEGYDVHKTVQSLRFYDAVRDHHPDLILLDLMMPYLAGEDELQLMKLSPETANIPVIVVTAKPEAEIRLEEPLLRKLGVVHIVNKPFDLNQLVQLVKQTVG